MATIHANTQRTWLLCGLTLFVAALTEILNARWIAIRCLQPAEAIATGQLDYPVEPCGVGEIARLTNAFQGMTRQLKTSFHPCKTALARE